MGVGVGNHIDLPCRPVSNAGPIRPGESIIFAHMHAYVPITSFHVRGPPHEPFNALSSYPPSLSLYSHGRESPHRAQHYLRVSCAREAKGDPKERGAMETRRFLGLFLMLLVVLASRKSLASSRS